MELYIPIERPQYNPTNGQFLKGHVPHNKGKKWEDYMDMRKAKRVIRIAKQNLKPNMNIGGWNRKAVVALDMEGNIAGWFASAMDAEKKTGICKRNINSVCNGKRKHAGGFKWEFA
jgi:hypothetical protein